jgi:hypothetical protein
MLYGASDRGLNRVQHFTKRTGAVLQARDNAADGFDSFGEH